MSVDGCCRRCRDRRLPTVVRRRLRLLLQDATDDDDAQRRLQFRFQAAMR